MFLIWPGKGEFEKFWFSFLRLSFISLAMNVYRSGQFGKVIPLFIWVSIKSPLILFTTQLRVFLWLLISPDLSRVLVLAFRNQTSICRIKTMIFKPTYWTCHIFTASILVFAAVITEAIGNFFSKASIIATSKQILFKDLLAFLFVCTKTSFLLIIVFKKLTFLRFVMQLKSNFSKESRSGIKVL